MQIILPIQSAKHKAYSRRPAKCIESYLSNDFKESSYALQLATASECVCVCVSQHLMPPYMYEN